jgi:hypothetical protein
MLTVRDHLGVDCDCRLSNNRHCSDTKCASWFAVLHDAPGTNDDCRLIYLLDFVARLYCITSKTTMDQNTIRATSMAVAVFRPQDYAQALQEVCPALGKRPGRSGMTRCQHSTRPRLCRGIPPQGNRDLGFVGWSTVTRAFPRSRPLSQRKPGSGQARRREVGLTTTACQLARGRHTSRRPHHRVSNPVLSRRPNAGGVRRDLLGLLLRTRPPLPVK